MFLLDDVVVISASDLTVAAHCEYAALRKLDALLGRAELAVVEDAMLERTARLGDAHEARRLEAYRASFGAFNPAHGRGVVEIQRPPIERYRDAAVLRAKHAETLDALRDGADVVFQGGFFDGRFHGWSDFLVREDDGRYSVHDTKLARHAKVTAVLQLAAYGDQLLRERIPLSPDSHLVLGDHSVTSHRLADVIPLYRHRRARLLEILDRHQAGDDAATWDDGLHSACGRCDECQAEATARRDVLLVAGMRTDQRARLLRAGIASIDDLAAHTGDVPGMAARTLDRLRAQARMQVRQAPASGDVGPVVAEVFAPEVIWALPPADPGDIFFDFEGDPLWSDGDPAHWGLEYLFGWVDAPGPDDAVPPFHALWAHDRAGERAALEAFVDDVTARRATHPGMHVYHYAPYETTALKRLVGRHGTREQELDALLRGGVFVDLYSTVRQSLRVSQPSYSIKKLEPLYMTAREGLDNAADSITDYALACEARDAGRPDEAAALLQRIADYNADDCRSTFLLREWLVAQAAALPPTETPSPEEHEEVGRPEAPRTALARELAARLVAEADACQARGATSDARAYRLLAAALEYWKREEKPAWWAHFARLTQPMDEWTDTRNVLRVAKCRLLSDWTKPPRGNLRRALEVTGELEAGSDVGIGAKVWTLYDGAAQSRGAGSGAGRTWNGSGATVTSVDFRADCAVLTLDEVLPRGGTPWGDLPMALVPPVEMMPRRPRTRSSGWRSASSRSVVSHRPRRSTCCGESRREGWRLRMPDRARESAMRPTSSARRCERRITPTLPSRARRAPGRPGPARASSSAWSRRVGGSVWWHSRTPWWRTCSGASSARAWTRRASARRRRTPAVRCPGSCWTARRRGRSTLPSAGPSSAGRRGTSPTWPRCQRSPSTCSSSTRPASSHWPRPSRSRRPPPGSCCSATRDSSRR